MGMDVDRISDEKKKQKTEKNKDRKMYHTQYYGVEGYCSRFF
jgi:hypothetical protein